MIRDIEISIAFYLSPGFTLKARWENHYAQFTSPGLAIELYPTSTDQLTGNSGNVFIGFTIDRFEEVKSYLEKINIAFQKRTEEGGVFLHITDPYGPALCFINPKW